MILKVPPSSIPGPRMQAYLFKFLFFVSNKQASGNISDYSAKSEIK